MTADPILVADIGGTNARFALARRAGGAIAVEDMKRYRASEFDTLRAAATAYLDSLATKPKAACFAVAGPVTDAVIEFTNSPWVLDVAEIKAALHLDKLRVVNDFEALACGVLHLGKDDFMSVRAGAGDKGAPVLVIGPGTGFGQAIIAPTQSGKRVISTEGGHVAFAPRTDEEIEIMKFIAREHGRVSVERVLSGAGLVNIHRALCARANAPRPLLHADEITKAALADEQSSAAKAVDLFCALLGAAAGDAVLATGARGGVVLGGGILPKISDIFLKSRFVERFLDKGRMRDYVDDVPVDLIVREGAARIGAAAMMLGGGEK